MPLTAKGNDILEAMRKEYGKEEGERIFYASRNAGVISGVDSEYELEGKSVFNLDNMAEQISSLGTEAKRLAERMDGRRFARPWGDTNSLGTKFSNEGWAPHEIEQWLDENDYKGIDRQRVIKAWQAAERRGDAERMETDAVKRVNYRELGAKYKRDGKSRQDLIFELKWRNVGEFDMKRALEEYDKT